MFFFLIFVLVTFLRVLYNNIHHHVNQRSKLHTYSAEVPVLHTPVEVRFSMTCPFVHGQGKRGNVHIPAIMSVAFPDVVFDGFIFYSRGNRTPESKKKHTSVYLIKRKMKNKILYTYQVRIYPLLLYTRSRCATYMYFSSTHPVSTAAQSTTITEASQSRGQK